MIVRAYELDEEQHKNWVFGGGIGAYKTENDQIGQDIVTALYEFKNDCFWALNHGIDWKQRMGFSNQKDLLDKDINDIASNRFGVVAITDFVSNVFERNYTCSFNVYTIYSENAVVINFSKEL